MNNKINTFQTSFATSPTLNMSAKHNSGSTNSAYIKQQIHDKKIDEFFKTSNAAPEKRVSILAAIGAVMGVIIPTLILGKNANKGMKIDSLKNLGKIMHLEYGLTEMLAVGIGGVAGGLAGGLIDRKESHKIEKIEEATYQFMNILFPALFITGIQSLCEKSKLTDKNYIKLPLSGVAMAIGLNLAVKASNKLDDKHFNKHNPDKDRVFKKKDLLVHFDDLVGALIIAKIPFANKLHAEKILPAIFAWSGYHVGDG